MGNENDGASGILPAEISETSLPSSGPLREDFSYRHVDGLSIKSRSFGHSLWTGAILTNCVFEDVDFSRCDFAGTRFVNCRFTNCDLEPDELRSCVLISTEFIRCNLSGIQSFLSRFERCVFDRCDLSGASVRECYFIKTVLRNCTTKGSGVTLNQFEECKFECIAFADATFLFLQFKNCGFIDCAMNAETIGYTYGITVSDLEKFKLIYLGGEEAPPDAEDIVDVIFQSYQSRRWYLGVCLLELNFELVAPLHAIRNFAKKFEKSTSAAARIDWDEINFLLIVLEQLHTDDALPLQAAWVFKEAFEKSIGFVEAEFGSGFGGAPSIFASRAKLASIVEALIDRALRTAPEWAAMPGQATMKLRYAQRPQASLRDAIQPFWLAELELIRELEPQEAYPGSWVEVFQASLAAIGAIHVVLYTADTLWEHSSGLLKKGKTTIEAVRRTRRIGGAKETVPETTQPDPLPAQLHNSSAPVSVSEALIQAAKIAEQRELQHRRTAAELDRILAMLAVKGDDEIDRLLEHAQPNLKSIEINMVD